MIDIYVNNIKLKVNKDLTVLQACNRLKIEIPIFCFQENLQIAGNCRMCLVEIENSPKPVAACAMPLMQNMRIFTDTPLVQKARESVLEFLLINHPLDCPICDQASECDLQDQSMIFGADRSRFFFRKRAVEDKYCGPFIKTIMTRCIHCTRCVRFAKEICRIDDLGSTGRGDKTEINFYYPKIFYSEFSGNVIDLCPVGALTSKPYAFKARSWETKKHEGIDVLDSIGSNIKIDVFHNEVVRILPRTNFNINKEWISNKTRFFFDSLRYQRIQHPLLKKDNHQFYEISWFEAFNIIHHHLIQTDSSKIKSIIGNLTDLESIFIFKKILNLFGISNISFENLFKNKKLQINSDFNSSFLFTNTLKSIEKVDLCLIVGSIVRNEGSILNIHLINRLKRGNFDIAYIGTKTNFTYPIQHIGLTLTSIIDIITGRHYFCKKLKKAKKPLIIVGENILNQKNGFYLISKLKNIAINFLSSQTSFINFLEITFPNLQKSISNANICYLFNTNLQSKLQTSQYNFIIYQGHHFTKDAQHSNLILPGLTFLEKNGMYINLDGFIQKNKQILNLNTKQRKDSAIYRNLYKFLIKRNKSQFTLFLSIRDTLPYLFRNKIRIVSNFKITKQYIRINNNFLDSLIKTSYYSNILEQYSKVLMNSNKIRANTSTIIL